MRVQARERGVQFPSDRVDPTEAREILLAARAQGLSYSEIERLTGLQRVLLQKLNAGKCKTINRDSHNLMVKYGNEQDLRAFTKTTPVAPDWTRQMVYSLNAQGYSASHQRYIIENNLGVSAGFLCSVRTGNYSRVQYGSEQIMRWLVSQIGSATGPSKSSAQRAARNGHFPTRHYDAHGKLVVSSLPKEKRQAIEGV